MWNINALPHLFSCLPSTSCHSHCNNHLSPLSPSLFLHCPPSLCTFSLARPHLSPVILFIPFFSPFCRGFPSSSSSHLTGSRSSVRSPALPLGGVAAVTGRMDDRWQGRGGGVSASQLLLPPPRNTPHSSPAAH